MFKQLQILQLQQLLTVYKSLVAGMISCWEIWDVFHHCLSCLHHTSAFRPFWHFYFQTFSEKSTELSGFFLCFYLVSPQNGLFSIYFLLKRSINWKEKEDGHDASFKIFAVRHWKMGYVQPCHLSFLFVCFYVSSHLLFDYIELIVI